MIIMNKHGTVCVYTVDQTCEKFQLNFLKGELKINECVMYWIELEMRILFVQ